MYYQYAEIPVGNGVIRGSAVMPEAGGKYPSVIFMHGFTVDSTGPNRFHLHFARRAVEAGFCCIRFDFYGCGESDGEFYEMTVGSEQRDAAAIMEWARKQPFVDAENLFLGGHSMGGLVTALVSPTVRPKAIFTWSVAMNMPYQAGWRTRTMKGPTERGWDIEGLELSRAYMEEVVSLDFQELAKDYPGDVLLVHGSADTDCPVHGSRILRHVYGDRARLHVIAEADHRMLSIPWREECYAVTLDFLKKHIC